jgi:aspartyl-tRNA(Asn)/glutamyl-tRNA(Gln) amidotransferase subunit B
MYTPTIGLEVHAELKTNSKMFCGCTNDPHASEPNTNICPICLAHPGTLPVPNAAAIKSVLLFGTAVGGELATYSEFDRKNYFYPDIPKAYQLSQYAFPFVKGGSLVGVELTRVHLEEDTARSQHDKGVGSLVDYNRAGVPLMELVTEPVIHDAETAGNFARELQLTLRTLGISDANMEKGEMRVEANISVSNTGQKAKKYVEVKNLNSFKSVEAAINFEIKRQTAVLEAGGEISQETRGWDEVKLETYVQRSKETAKDYRYFPDPDIPKFNIGEITEFSPTALQAIMPELPSEKRSKYSVLGLPSEQIEVLIQDVYLDTYFGSCIAIKPELAILIANYALTDLAVVLPRDGSGLCPMHFVDLMAQVQQKKITSRVAKDLIIEFGAHDADIVAVAHERNLLSTFTAESLTVLLDAIISDHHTVVAEFNAGKETSLQFLIGQAMKQTKGAADPVLIKTVLLERIKLAQ